jgi:hypothetical protein
MLDLVLPEEGQRHRANAFLRPNLPEAMSAEVRGRYLPSSRPQPPLPMRCLHCARLDGSQGSPCPK